MAMRFRALADQDAAQARLDSLIALYDRRSGETHLLAQPMPELIAALQAGEADAATLLARLGVPVDAAALAGLSARLDELAAIGLVERI